MSRIRVMSENLANKIAAGEVVEKCVSIVKELVENSIDAKSTDIRVELKEAGLREIKIIDNGIGMDREDAKLAFQRHATSKLYEDDDLFFIKSLGFRGEALPSIAAVANVVLKTCQNDIGTMIHIKGGKILEVSDSELRAGTVITINNLFYNTPARLKHLASPYSELANIVEYVNKMALSYPKVKFLLVNDDKEILNTDGSGNLLKVIKSIYGLNITKRMIEVKGENLEYKVHGYVSMPEVSRASRNYMTTIVNGRVVKNAVLNKTINEAYSKYKEDSRYPIVILIIETDPSLIDVNIHPSKLDIKFSNFDDLRELITGMIDKAIRDKLLIPKIENPKEEKNNIKYENLSLNLEREIIKDDEPDDANYKTKLSDLINFNYNSDLDIENFDGDSKDVNIGNDIEDYVEDLPSDRLPELYPVGLALGTYMVCQNDTGIYLIDQHAAQERINYEKYSYLLSHPNSDTIGSIVPFVIELPTSDYLIIKNNMDILSKLNIEIEEFGQNSFRIVRHPTWFVKDREEVIVRNILEMIIKEEKHFDLEKFIKNVAATMACKASIKGNTRITEEDMESLINQLRQCKNPFNCPHGRPTIIHFTIYEIEKMFHRSLKDNYM